MKAVVLSGFDEGLATSLKARLEISNRFQQVMNESELSSLTAPPTVFFDPQSAHGAGRILGEIQPIHEELDEINALVKERFGPFSGLVLFSAALPKEHEEKHKRMVEVNGVPIFRMGSGYESIVETLNSCNEVRHAFFAFLKHEVGKALQLYRDTCFVVNRWIQAGNFDRAHKELSMIPEIFARHRQQLEELESALQASKFVKLQNLDSYFLVPEMMAGGISPRDEVYSADFTNRQTGASTAVSYLMTTLTEMELVHKKHLSSVRNEDLISGLPILQKIVDDCAASFLALGRNWNL